MKKLKTRDTPSTSSNSIERLRSMEYDEQEIALAEIIDEIETSSHLHGRHLLRKLLSLNQGE
jgi:hypothetical protein